MLGILRIIDYFSFNQDIILRKLKVGDGRNGCPEEGPYDVIHVGAGAEEIPKAVWDYFSSCKKYLNIKEILLLAYRPVKSRRKNAYSSR